MHIQGDLSKSRLYTFANDSDSVINLETPIGWSKSMLKLRSFAI